MSRLIQCKKKLWSYDMFKCAYRPVYNKNRTEVKTKNGKEIKTSKTERNLIQENRMDIKATYDLALYVVYNGID